MKATKGERNGKWLWPSFSLPAPSCTVLLLWRNTRGREWNVHIIHGASVCSSSRGSKRLKAGRLDRSPSGCLLTRRFVCASRRCTISPGLSPDATRKQGNHNAIRNILIGCLNGVLISVMTAKHILMHHGCQPEKRVLHQWRRRDSAGGGRQSVPSSALQNIIVSLCSRLFKSPDGVWLNEQAPIYFSAGGHERRCKCIWKCWKDDPCICTDNCKYSSKAPCTTSLTGNHLPCSSL